ncbi:MAG: hypothetical protein ACHP7N_05125 [Caulobacterales bacterium]
MSLSDLASIGSLVSGLAVVVSFVFLGLQIRQSNRNQRSLMQQGRSDKTVALMLRLTDPTLQESMIRGRAGDLTMSPAQVDAFVRAWIATFAGWEDGYLQHRAGMMDAASMASDAATHRVFLSYPGCRAAWKTSRGQFTGAFRDYIDQMVRGTNPMQPPDTSATWKAFVAEDLAALQAASGAAPTAVSRS